MANQKVSQLVPKTTLTPTDQLYLIDPLSKRMTISEFNQNYGPSNLLTPPIDSEFSWINQGGASISTGDFGIALTLPPSGAGTLSWRIRDKAAPATPYTITACLSFIGAHADTVEFTGFGIGWRNAAAGTIHEVELQSFLTDTPTFRSRKLTNPTTFSADYASFRFGHVKNPMYFQISDDGVNRITRLSADGINFIQFTSVVRTDFLTPDRVFFGGIFASASLSAIVTLHSWRQS